MLCWEIVSRTAALTSVASTSTIVMYGLFLVAGVTYAQILRDINDELADR